MTSPTRSPKHGVKNATMFSSMFEKLYMEKQVEETMTKLGLSRPAKPSRKLEKRLTEARQLADRSPFSKRVLRSPRQLPVAKKATGLNPFSQKY